MAKQMKASRPPRARASSVPAFGGWEAGSADYSLDFTKVRADRMQRRTKALSWSSFVVGNAAVAVAVETPPGGGKEEKRRQWSSAAATSDDDDDHRERRRSNQHGYTHQQLRRLRSADDDDDRRQPIQPGRAASKGRSKVKGYLFGCVGGQW